MGTGGNIVITTVSLSLSPSTSVTVNINEYGTGSAPTSNSGAINEAVSNVSSSIETSRESVVH